MSNQDLSGLSEADLRAAAGMAPATAPLTTFTPAQQATYAGLPKAFGAPGTSGNPYYDQGDRIGGPNVAHVMEGGGISVPSGQAGGDLHGLSEAGLRSAIAGGGQAPPVMRSDEGLGFMHEASRPLHNLTQWAMALNGGGEGDDPDSSSFTPGLVNPGFHMTPEQEQANFDRPVQEAAARGVVPGKIGGVAGSIVGSLPTAALGPIGGGVASGLLSTTNPRDALQTAMSGLFGGAAGKLGDSVMRGAIQTVAPTISRHVQTLLNIGMGSHLTPGQISGKLSPLGVAEQVFKATPFAGELIRNNQNRSLSALAPAVADHVARRFGRRVESGTAEDMSAALRQAKNHGYNIRTPGGTELDPIYAAQVSNIRNRVQDTLAPTNFPRDFDRLTRREIAGRADPSTGVLSDEALTDAKSAINQERADWAGDSGGYARKYKQALIDLRTALTGNLSRADPAAAEQLARADAAYPSYKVAQDAFRRGTQRNTNEENLFVPSQLQQAVTAGYNGGGIASEAPLQDIASAAKAVLPRKFQDVASPGHTVMEGLIGTGVAGADVLHGSGGALTAAVGSVVPFYTQAVQAALSRTLLGNAARRAALEESFGPLQNLTNPVFALSGSQAGRPGEVLSQFLRSLQPVSP